jgi:rubrerythrin
MSRPFESLTPEEVLALAVHVERANTERFRTFASVFRGYDEAVADRFEELAQEEEGHERLLLARFRESFGGEIPTVTEQDVEGVIESPDMDDPEHLIFGSLELTRVYEIALKAERQALAFYRRAAAAAAEPELRLLYEELASMEDGHQSWLEEKLKESPHVKKNDG